MSETGDKIIKEIHARQVKRRPRWHFLIRNASVWTFFIAALAFGALSFSIEEGVIEKGICAHHATGSSVLQFVFHDLSFLWVFSALLFIVLAFLNLRLTTEGYRYRTLWIVLAVFFILVMFVLLMHHEGFGGDCRETNFI